MSAAVKREKAPLERAARALNHLPRGGAVTPAQIQSAVRQLDGGDFFEAALLWDRMEDADLHLASIMDKRARSAPYGKMAVLPALEAGQKKPSARAAEIANFVSAAVFAIPNLTAALRDIQQTGLGYGAALTEIHWAVRGGSVVIERLEPKPCHQLTYVNHDDPETLLEFPRWVTRANARGEELDRRRFFLYAPLAGRRHPTRAGMYRGLVWYWLFSQFTIKDWLAFNEVFGAPLRIGKYAAASATDDDKQALREALAALGQDGYGLIPDHMMIEIIEAARSGTATFRPAADYFNAEKSKRVLGQTLTTEQQGSSSSLAMAEVHERGEDQIVADDAAAIAAAFTRDVIEPLVVFNFGPQAAYPYLSIPTEPAKNVGAALYHAEKLGALGYTVPVEDLQELTGFTLAPRDPPAETADAANAALNAAQIPEHGRAAAAVMVADALFESARGELLERAYAELTELVAGTLDDNGVMAEPLTGEQLADTGYLDTILRLGLTAQVAAHAAVMAEARAAALVPNAALNAAAPDYAEVPGAILTPEEAARWWAGRLSLASGDYAELAAGERRAAFAIARLDNQRVALRLKRLFDGALAEPASGLLTFRGWYRAALDEAGAAGRANPFINRAHAETVFRNNLQNAYNAGRYNALMGTTSSVFPYFRLSVVQDGATSDTCKALAAANVVLPRDHPYWKKHWPPFHHNCRTTVVGVSRYDTRRAPLERAPAGVPYDDGFLGNPALASIVIADGGKNF